MYPQLTKRRADLLSFAKSKLEIDDPSFSNVDYVFADNNCIIKLKTKCGSFYGFNTELEFMSLISWISTNEENEIEDNFFEEYNDGDEYNEDDD